MSWNTHYPESVPLCGFDPQKPGYAPCSRKQGHDGPCALRLLGEMTIDQTLLQLEDAMYARLDQPVTGDFLSLTAEWRWILERFAGEMSRLNQSRVGIMPLSQCLCGEINSRNCPEHQ